MSGTDDDTFGSSAFAGDLVGLPAFFTGGDVDDKKYEDLLADLRAHDLLGPDDGLNEETFGRRADEATDNLPSFFKEGGGKSTSTVSAPPGFDSAPPGFSGGPPPGLGHNRADLEWAQGQEKFNQLQEAYAGQYFGDLGFSGLGLGMGGFGASIGLGYDSTYLGMHDGEDDSGSLYDMDESHLANFYTLGLDDDDITGSKGSPTSVSPIKRMGSPQSQLGSPPKGSSFSPELSGSVMPTMLTLDEIETDVETKASRQEQSLPQPPPPLPREPPAQQFAPRAGTYPPPQFIPPPGWRPGMPMPRGYPPMPMQYAQGVPPHHHGRNQMPPRPFVQNLGPRGFTSSSAGRQPLVRNFKVMTARDIQFVVQQQMKQLRSSDPFSDDYYYHNFVQKKSRQSNQAAAPPLPLPSWKLQHVRSVDPRDASIANKSRTWESVNQVLGRNDKTSLYCPRETLNLIKESESAGETSEGGVEKSNIFSGSSWDHRRNVEKGMRCLLALQDARHLLDARGINPQQFHQQDVRIMDPTLVQLRSKTAELLLELASILGVTSVDPLTTANTAVCDTSVLLNILATVKGKRLVCRALPLLHPTARFVLLPKLMELLMRPPSEEGHVDMEERLCHTLVIILLYHPPTPPAAILADCIEVTLRNQTLETLTAILHNRPRAEVLQALLHKGPTICRETDEKIGAKWSHWEKCFIEMATEIKAASITTAL